MTHEDVDGLDTLLAYLGDRADLVKMIMPDGSVITLEDDLAEIADRAIFDALMARLIQLKEAQMCSGV